MGGRFVPPKLGLQVYDGIQHATLDRSNGKSLGMAIGNAASPTSGIKVLIVNEGQQAHATGVLKVGSEILSINGR